MSRVLPKSALGRIRTCGLLLRRQTLYPLSYEGGGALGTVQNTTIVERCEGPLLGFQSGRFDR